MFPGEVEAVLRDCPGIEDVCVVGMADEDWGQVVVALYVPAGVSPLRGLWRRGDRAYRNS